MVSTPSAYTKEEMKIGSYKQYVAMPVVNNYNNGVELEGDARGCFVKAGAS